MVKAFNLGDWFGQGFFVGVGGWVYISVVFVTADMGSALTAAHF